MKRSLWILTSCSLALFVGAILFVSLTGLKKPKLKPLKSIPAKELRPKTLRPQEISLIYENDLFDTYVPKPIKKIDEPVIKAPPRAPTSVTVPRISPQEPKFLEPLSFTLSGTIVTPDPQDNLAILTDNRSKTEKSYKIGDDIEDGQLIEIKEKSVVIIRSNGQQETLYLPGADKILKALNNSDTPIAAKIKSDHYAIDPRAFTLKIKSLGDLIDNLNLTTAYQDGVSIGCKVGPMTKESIGHLIGLEKGDIITKIDNQNISTLEERINVYNKIIELKEDNSFDIELKRSSQNIIIKYTLKPLDKPWFEPVKKEAPFMQEMIKEDLERRYRFAPTVAEIREKERAAIVKQLHGKNKP